MERHEDVHMSTPELKQAEDLGVADFEQHPVWISVHTADYDMPWYEQCDEETYRPWIGPLPVLAKENIFLVSAEFKLKCGIFFRGFFSPVGDDWDEALTRTTTEGRTIKIRTFSERQGGSPAAILKLQQPHIFVNGQRFGFWGGRSGLPVEKRHAFYAAIGEPPESIFPIQFAADPALVTGIVAGQVDGFYRSIAGQPPIVEL
jgi:hypothetical protein